MAANKTTPPTTLATMGIRNEWRVGEPGVRCEGVWCEVGGGREV